MKKFLLWGVVAFLLAVEGDGAATPDDSVVETGAINNKYKEDIEKYLDTYPVADLLIPEWRHLRTEQLKEVFDTVPFENRDGFVNDLLQLRKAMSEKENTSYRLYDLHKQLIDTLGSLDPKCRYKLIEGINKIIIGDEEEETKNKRIYEGHSVELLYLLKDTSYKNLSLLVEVMCPHIRKYMEEQQIESNQKIAVESFIKILNAEIGERRLGELAFLFREIEKMLEEALRYFTNNFLDISMDKGSEEIVAFMEKKRDFSWFLLSLIKNTPHEIPLKERVDRFFLYLNSVLKRRYEEDQRRFVVQRSYSMDRFLKEIIEPVAEAWN